jgi:hypothetical protein
MLDIPILLSFFVGIVVSFICVCLSRRIRKAFFKACIYVANKAEADKRLEQLEFDAREIADACIDLLIKKQRDYGRENIALFGETGIIVRLNDKQERLNKLVLKNLKPANESLKDTYMDKINYCIIALLIRDGKW